MQTLSVTTRGSMGRDDARWVAALLGAIARDEAAERRPRRLTEAGLATWERFKGRLGLGELVALLFEDGAVTHPIPFDSQALGGKVSLRHVGRDEVLLRQWLEALQTLDLTGDPGEYIVEQARLLGLTTQLGRSNLPVVKPHQRVLELPGSGGQLTHHLLRRHPELSLKDNFVIAASEWQELALAGIVALEVGAVTGEAVVYVPPAEMKDLTPLREGSFDLVIGLAPEKGGLFRVEDQLAIWFSGARIALV